MVIQWSTTKTYITNTSKTHMQKENWHVARLTMTFGHFRFEAKLRSDTVKKKVIIISLLNKRRENERIMEAGKNQKDRKAICKNNIMLPACILYSSLIPPLTFFLSFLSVFLFLLLFLSILKYFGYINSNIIKLYIRKYTIIY